MYLEYNYRCPEPYDSIEELIKSIHSQIGKGTVTRNSHGGPFIDSCSNEEYYHSQFQLIKMGDWCYNIKKKFSYDKLCTIDFIKYCSDNGYDCKEKIVCEEKFIEVTLPNGSLLIGNDEKYEGVTVAFIDFVVFAEYETSETFLALMNDLLKFLSKAEGEYQSVIENAQQAFTESNGQCDGSEEEDEDEDEDTPYETGVHINEDEDGNLIFKINDAEFKMIKVEAGTFMMGSAENQMNEADKERELPSHQVTIKNDFYIGEVPVTFKLMSRITGFWGCPDNDDDPMCIYDWYETYRFINDLNEMTGKQFRLPTEAEWEFAARGGNKSNGYKYSGSNNPDEVAWYDGNSSNDYSHPVRQKNPNELGLYDMSGNMWEICHDGYAAYPSDPQVDPIGDPDEKLKVVRGGCFSDSDKSCRTSERFFVGPRETSDDTTIFDNTTLRLVLSPFMPDDIPTSFE